MEKDSINTKSPAPVLIEEYRGDVLECEYRGHVVGISYDGGIRYVTGNAQHMTYMRSAGKPIQAIPAYRVNVAEQYGFDSKEQAIMMASHRAEAFHVEVLQSMMNKLGLHDADLSCASTYPLNASAREELVKKGEPEQHIYHNCSGKHLGILAACKHYGYPLTDYASPEHPIQREVIEALGMMADYAVEDIQVGIDGCGFPVFALPLYNIARSYLKLACPELIADAITRTAVERLTAKMNEHPEMVAGTDMICSALLMDDNIVAKGGAQGVYCFGLRKEKMAFALKVMDGSESRWPMIVASILEQIGYDTQETIDCLYALHPKIAKNGSGTVVGDFRAVFALK